MSELEQCALLRDLPDDDRARVVALTRLRSLRSGEILFHRGDTGRDVFVVTGGTLEVLDDDGMAVARIGPGGLVGERAVLNGGSRNATIRAARDTEVGRIPGKVVRGLLDAHPVALRGLAGLLAERVSTRPMASTSTGRRVAVIDLTGSSDVAARLVRSLALFGPATLVDAARAEREVGPGASAAMPGTPLAKRVGAWLDRVEAGHAHMVLVGSDRRWTARCLRDADEAIAVCDGPPDRHRLPPGFEGHLAIARHGGAPTPGIAGAWVGAVPAARIVQLDTTDARDIDRLARVVAGRAIGLVLGGGGARGFAHLGVLRAFETCGVPIDSIGGTSIGALMGATAAMGWNDAVRMAKATESLVDTRRLLGWTLPLASISSASKLTKILRSPNLFGDTAIEDLRVPYFAVSASFTTGDAVVHDDGPLWLATRASASLPGIMPPVYAHEDLLVDGGVVNNVPVDVMRTRVRGRVVAVNLRGHAPAGWKVPFDPALSGWRVLGSRMHPRREAIRLPGPASMMLRAKELGGTQAHQERLALADLVLEPPVADVDNLNFKAGRPLVEPAYRHTVEQLEAWLS